MRKVNWIKIQNEYINGDISYRKLADKHKIKFSTLRDRAIKEKWAESKETQRNKTVTNTVQKTAEKIAESESDYIINMAEINFGLAELIKKNIGNNIEPKDIKSLTAALKDISEIQKNIKGIKEIYDGVTIIDDL